MKTKLIQIELQSDLAAGSGYAFGTNIDSDIVYDDVGLPYIPSRRIKGVMREAAENIAIVLKHPVSVLFGKGKENDTTGIMVEDGLLENHASIRKMLVFEKDVSDQDVLSLFTSVRTQTRMEDGIADDKSLRKIRLVNQYSPMEKGKNLVFFAPVSCQEEWEEDIKNILLAVRSIGLKRNRGLGSVKCSLGTEVEKVGFAKMVSDDGLSIMIEVENELPLMISAGSDTRSESYIPARNVIGALASRYLRNGNASDETFSDLFLNGSTCYTNLYPCDEEGRYIPAPAFLQKRKLSGRYGNIMKNQSASLDNEGVPKKLNGKYVLFKGNDSFCLKETDRKIIYHHRKRDDAILYTSTALSERQRFAGYITFKNTEQRDIVLGLLGGGSLRFGKSKTAQYGKCRILKITDAIQESKKYFKSGDVLLVVLSSNALFMDDNGYTVVFSKVYDEIAKCIGLSSDQYCHLDGNGHVCGDEKLMSYTAVDMEYGYQSVWNMRKAPVPSIAAGSTFVYKICKDVELTNHPVGVKCFEGYGEVMLCNVNDFDAIMKKVDPSGITESQDSGHAERLLKKVHQEKLYRDVRDLMLSEVKELQMSSSTIGRVTLMVKECGEENLDARSAFVDFNRRVDSIKSNRPKNEIKSYIAKYFDSNGLSDGFKKRIQTFTSYQKLDHSENFVFGRWEDLLLECLSKMKYMNKEKGE